MTCVWTGNSRIIIGHTMVSDELRGKSAGKKMLQKVVEFARHKEIKIIPLCPFAQSLFSKNLEFHDLLQK